MDNDRFVRKVNRLLNENNWEIEHIRMTLQEEQWEFNHKLKIISKRAQCNKTVAYIDKLDDEVKITVSPFTRVYNCMTITKEYLIEVPDIVLLKHLHKLLYY